ncbi:MAG: hypothetical protein FJX64_04830 [Alphaproteobacteria bacterium]|nr:hypothetical protein [Alphaproteobacteria bacterium]
MSLDADAIADGRRLKRRLVVWRLLALVIALGAIGYAVWGQDRIALGNRIAQIDIDGIILDDEDRLRELRRIAGDDSVKALIVRLDSPGGTVVAGEELYRALREVGAAKSVVAVIGGTGASAAYMVALAADRIVARENSLTGSIGVVMQTFDLTGTMQKLGVTPTLIKSAPLKDQPNPFEPITHGPAAFGRPHLHRPPGLVPQPDRRGGRGGRGPHLARRGARCQPGPAPTAGPAPHRQPRYSHRSIRAGSKNAVF